MCPIDWNVVYCVLHYEPELLLLLFLAVVCSLLALRPVKN